MHWTPRVVDAASPNSPNRHLSRASTLNMSGSFLDAASRRAADAAIVRETHEFSPLAPLDKAFTVTTPRRPILHDAAKRGDVQSIERILAMQAGNLDDLKYGFAPIHLAAKGGHVKAVSLLLDSGSAVEARALSGATPLHCAAEANSTEVLSLLLMRGANLHAEANERDSVLHTAALNGRLAATRLLVAKGADVHATNVRGTTPWDDAANLGRGRCSCEDPNAREWRVVALFLAHVMPLDVEARIAFATRGECHVALPPHLSVMGTRLKHAHGPFESRLSQRASARRPPCCMTPPRWATRLSCSTCSSS